MLSTPDPHALHARAGDRLAAASAALARGEAERSRRLRLEAEQLMVQCREALAIPNVFRGSRSRPTFGRDGALTSRNSEV